MAIATIFDCATGEANEVTVPDPAPTAPNSVSMRQARLALNAANLYDQVVDAINAADTPTKIWWDTSPVLERDNDVLAHVATSLSLTSQQVDNLFLAAAALP